MQKISTLLRVESHPFTTAAQRPRSHASDRPARGNSPLLRDTVRSRLYHPYQENDRRPCEG